MAPGLFIRLDYKSIRLEGNKEHCPQCKYFVPISPGAPLALCFGCIRKNDGLPALLQIVENV